MIREVFLAAALFLAIEGAISAFWPSWAKRKMAELQNIPDRALGFAGLLFVVVGSVFASMADGAFKIAMLALVLEGVLYGMLPTFVKRLMQYALKSTEAIVKVWGETALGIGLSALVLFY